MKSNKSINLLNEYSSGDSKNFIELKFLKKISKSKVFVTPSGLICHIPSLNTRNALNKWKNKIFSTKISVRKLKYTANNAVMRARHYYSAIFINDLLSKKKTIKFCDFGSGEGNFISEIIKLNKKIKIYFTEDSKKNFNNIKKQYKKNIIGYNGTIEDCNLSKDFKNFDAASLTWTLSNCVNPVNVLKSIYDTLNKNGILLVSESSRILVPFKKPINNLFNSTNSTHNTHPWFFSYNSLSNLLEICGFEVIKSNRFYDENDLVVVAKKKKMEVHLKLE